jgi:hypothetical protein
MSEDVEPPLVHVGRAISAEELALIRETVELFPALSLSELAETLCDHLEWYTASGTSKRRTCEELLERLEARGWVRLPERKSRRPRQRVSVTGGPEAVRAESPIEGKLSELGRVELRVVEGREETTRWNEAVERHHYLGYASPAGCRLRYFIESDKGRLGCVLLAGAARAIAVRDQWIGWTRGQRLRNLGWVVNNTRFLLFAWVRVPHLASHVLGQLARRVGQDWEGRWGYRPVLLETFVDPARYRGTCYRASGWELVGQTTGEGLARPGKEYRTTPKLVYVRPLVEGFRERLCSDALVGRRLDP